MKIIHSFLSEWTSHQTWNYHSASLVYCESQLRFIMRRQEMRGGLVSTLLSGVRHYLAVWGKGCRDGALFPGNGLCSQASFLEQCRKLVQSPWRQEHGSGVGRWNWNVSAACIKIRRWRDRMHCLFSSKITRMYVPFLFQICKVLKIRHRPAVREGSLLSLPILIGCCMG